jgi:hypothetical protein
VSERLGFALSDSRFVLDCGSDDNAYLSCPDELFSGTPVVIFHPDFRVTIEGFDLFSDRDYGRCEFPLGLHASVGGLRNIIASRNDWMELPYDDALTLLKDCEVSDKGDPCPANCWHAKDRLQRSLRPVELVSMPFVMHHIDELTGISLEPDEVQDRFDGRTSYRTTPAHIAAVTDRLIALRSLREWRIEDEVILDAWIHSTKQHEVLLQDNERRRSGECG